MKFHLPLSLLRSLLSAMAVAAVSLGSSATAAIMHPGISIMTYTDFGQNMGRYVADGYENAVLAYIREQEGGVQIKYIDPSVPANTLPHGMIDFSSQLDAGYAAAISYNFLATVQHNQNVKGTFSGNFIGGGNSIYYQSVDIVDSNKFKLSPSCDYRISRLTKLVTDVAGLPVYGQDDHDWSGLTQLAGQQLYRAGSGAQWRGVASSSRTTNKTNLCGAYAYTTGAVVKIDGSYYLNKSTGAFATITAWDDYTSPKGINAASPLTCMAWAGDSGSPVWVWNNKTGQYEYVTACQSGDNQHWAQYLGAPEWTVNTMESFNLSMDLGTAPVTLDASGKPVVEVHIGAVNTSTGVTIRDSAGRSTTPWKGVITDAKGNVIAEYIGMKQGHNTWKDLSDWKDKDNWFHYGYDKFDTSAAGFQDYLQVNDLVFTSRTGNTNIVLDADIDLGIGYMRLCKDKDLPASNVTISGGHMFNSAGYVIDSGVNLHLQLTNGSDRTREWRAIVEKGGALYIEGEGDNTNMLLNLGRQGTTYLQREGGYAAYNVLQSTGGTVVIKDINQIKRDFTFGNQGGVLDMNGNSMTWNNSQGIDAAGFTIHALDEHAVIANRAKGTTTTLTWTQTGSQTWLGSFQDTADSVFRFVYDGGEGSVLTWRSIRTNLQNEDSGIFVDSGKLSLTGRNTVHAMGSANGRNANRFSSTNDWHYADATANVTVNDGGTFELASHARLTGNVTINAGGTFVMKEGVKNQMEYVEGGERLENTDLYKAFFGLKGDIVNNGTFMVNFSSGITCANEYAGNISGSGATIIDTGVDNGKFVFSGNDTSTGGHEVRSGYFTLKGASALGANTTGDGAWNIREKGVLAVEGVALPDVMPHIHAASNGALALVADATNLDMSGTPNLFIGAIQGQTIHFGEAGTAIQAWHTTDDNRTQWLFGGGGGNLSVDGLLVGDSDLVLGNAYTRGVVTLTNANNSFTGNIIFNGPVTLDCTDVGALGTSNIILGYGNRVSSQVSLNRLASNSSGATILGEGDVNIDLSRLQGVSLSAAGDMTYTGGITVAEGAAYRFGVLQDATLTLATDLSAGHDLVLDAQTYSGGTVVIERAQAVNGAVTVQGYDAAQAHVDMGDMTLKLTAENALAAASSLMVRNGGKIDVAGTNQTFNNVTIAAGGTITDSVNGAVLTINNSSAATFAGTMDVDTIVKNGGGALTLSGANYFDTLDVYGGTLTVNNADALAAGSITRMHNNTSVNLNANVQSRIYLEGGNLTLGGSGNVSGNGAIIAAGGKTSYVYLAGSTHAFSGEVGAEVGSTLRFQKPNANSTRTLALWATNINSAGGNIICDLKVNLDNGGTQTVGGTVTLTQATTMGIVTSYIGRTAGSVKNLDTVFVAGGTSQAYIYDHGVSGVWNIQHLNGGGNSSLQYTLRETAVGGANTIRFTGEGNYAGRVSYGATANSGYRNYWSVFFEIAHDKALQNAFLLPSAYNDSGSLDSARTGQIRAAIAVNTENARIRALGGSSTAHVYAGAAAGGAQANAPVSTRAATLTIGIGSGDSCTYSGSISSNAETGKGIHLVMDGLGNQAFNGTNVSLLSATGLRGVLKLNSNGVIIGRDLAIGQGGTIWWGANAASGDGTYSLDAGKSFSAIASPHEVASNVSANFNGSLSLNGGTLRFESALLRNADTALSIIGSISKGAAFGEKQYVDVIDAVSLDFGHEYHLANGDWSGIGGNAFALAPFSPYADNYIDAAFTTSTDGLFATFSLADNAYLWNGTDEGHAWVGSSFFNAPASTPGAADVAVFSNIATNTDVRIGESVNVGGLLFDSDNDYTLTVADGGSVTAASLVMLRDAKATVNAETNLGSVVVDKGQLTLNGDTAVDQGVQLNDGTAATVNGAATIGGDLTLGNNVAALVRDGADITGAASLGNGSVLALGGQSTAASLSLAANTALAGQGEGASLSVSGTMGLQGGGIIEINGINLTAATGVRKSFAANSTSIVLSNGAVVDDRNSYYGISNGGTLSFSGVETWVFVPDENGAVDDEGNPMGEYVLQESSGGTYYINGFRLSDASGQAASTVSVARDVTLVITGDAAGQAGSFAFSHWPTGANNNNRNLNPANVVSVSGTLTSNAALSNWDAPGLLNVNSGGTVNLLNGLTRVSDRTNDINVIVGDGARVNAAGGTQNDNLLVTLATGSTLGAIGDNVTFSNILSLGTPNAAGVVTIDTDAHSVGADFALIKGTGGQMAFSDAVTSLNGTGLAIAGSGTATFTGALTIASDLQVKDTATFVSRGNRLDIRGAMSVAEGASATLDGVNLLSGFTLTEGSLNLAGNITLAVTGIENSGDITIADGTSFALNYDYFKNDTYTLISGDGTISYAGGTPVITVAGFNMDGVNPVITASGNTLSISYNIPNLLWNGAEGQGWNASDNAWSANGGAAAFANMARVTFDGGGSHEVAVSGSHTALEMTIDTAEGYHFSSANGGALAVYTDMTSNSATTTRFDVATTVNRDAQLSGSHSFTNLTVGRNLSLEGDGSATAVSGNLAVTGNITLDGEGSSLTVTGTTSAGDLTIGGTDTRADFAGAVTANTLTINGAGANANFTASLTTTGKMTIGEGATATFNMAAASQSLSLASNEVRGRMVMDVADGITWNMGFKANTAGAGVLVKEGAGTLVFTTTGNAPGHVELRAGTLEYKANSALGTLDVTGDADLFIEGAGNPNTHSTTLLNIAEGVTLGYVAQWGETWNINKMTGSGTLVNTGGLGTGVRPVNIGGNGGFSGTIVMNNQYSSLSLTAAGALNGAYINMMKNTLYVKANNTLRGLDGASGTNLSNSNNSSTLTINTDAGGDYTFNGNITGTAASALALAVGGEGSQTFTQAGTFRVLTQSGGTLNLQATTVVGVLTQSGGTLNVNGDATVASTKLSGGELHVTGNTTVGGAFSSSGAAHATLGGDLSVTGTFIAAGNSVVEVAGDTGVTGNFTATDHSAVTISGTAQLDSDLLVYGTSSLEVQGDATIGGKIMMSDTASITLSGSTNTINGMVVVSGSLHLGGSLTLGDNITNGGTVTFAEGTTLNLASESLAGEGRTLVTGGTINHSLGVRNLVIDGQSFSDWKDDYRVRISDVGNLSVAILEGSQNLDWSGSVDGNWDTSAYNWDKGEMRFVQADTVSFGADAANKAITVAEDGVTVAAMTVDGTGYSFSGGAIAVDGPLTVNGTATFNNALTSNGVVTVTADGMLTLGGALTLASTVSNSGTVNFTDSVLINLASSSLEGDGFTLVSGTGTLNHSLALGNLMIDGKGYDAWKGDYRVHIGGDANTLTVSLVTGPIDLEWSGTTNGTWDTNHTNWEDGSESFTENDNVIFGNAPDSSTVTVVDTGVKTGDMTVNGDGYSFSGGAIAVGGDMTVNGAETSFASNVTVSKDLVVNGEATFLEDVSVERDVIVKADADGSFAKELTVAGNVSLEDGAKIVMTKDLTLTEDARLALGSGSDAKLAGLNGGEDATVGFTGTGEAAALNITTEKNTTHVFSGEIGTGMDDANIALKVDGEGTQKLAGFANVASAAVDGGTLELVDAMNVGNEVSVSADGTLTLVDNAMVMVGESVTLSRSAKAVAAGVATALKNIAVNAGKVEGIATGETRSLLADTDVRWTNQKLKLSNLTIASTSRIGTMALATGLSLFDDGSVTAEVEFENTVLLLDKTNASPWSVPGTGIVVNDEFGVIESGSKYVTLTCNTVFAQKINGNLLLDINALWNESVGWGEFACLVSESDYISISFNNSESFAQLASDAQIYLQVGDYEPLLGARKAGSDSVYFRTSDLKLPSSPSPAVPEPATATLSMLALAALAMRRRRKAVSAHEA